MTFRDTIKSTDNLPYEKVGNKEPVCIADEVPFEIPASWEWVRLGDIFQHNTGKALNASNRDGELLEYITTSNLYWNRFELDSLRKMYFTESEIEKCTVTKGDLLVCEGGDIGRAAIWCYDFDIRIQNHIHRLRAYSELCTEYFYYLFFLFKNVGWIGGKGIGIQGLSSNALHNLLFPLPPLGEQKRIVECILSIKPYTDNYAVASEKINKLNDDFPEILKKSILQQAIMGKLVPQDDRDEPASVLLDRIRAEKATLIKAGKLKKDKHESIIYRRDNSHYEKVDGTESCIDDEIDFEIPRTWAWCRLSSLLIKTTTGPFGSMLHKNDYSDFGIPIINPANICNGIISTTGIKYVSHNTAERMASYRLSKGDIIIGRRGEMGRSAVIKKENENWLCGTGCFFVSTHSGFVAEYLVFLLKSPYMQKALHKKSVGTTMENINHNILSRLLVPLPPTSEQIKILKSYNDIITFLAS